MKKILGIIVLLTAFLQFANLVNWLEGDYLTTIVRIVLIVSTVLYIIINAMQKEQLKKVFLTLSIFLLAFVASFTDLSLGKSNRTPIPREILSPMLIGLLGVTMITNIAFVSRISKS